MLKNFFKLSLVLGLAAALLSPQANSQTVVLQIVGSSAFWLEAGLGANYSAGPINAPCVWSASGGVVATDPTVTSSNTDSGSAWVAWTKGTGGSCTSPASDAKVYAYLNTDSVVGNRCLFNACTLDYSAPTGTLPAGSILGGAGVTTNCGTTGECALPSSLVTLLHAKATNVAATDIRPEDAEWAITRALGTSTAIPCGSAIASTQYLSLGYANNSVINSAITGSTKKFNVIKFNLPSTAPNVQIVGATAVVVAVHSSGDANGFAVGGTTISSQNFTSSALAKYLDGTTNTTPGGEPANVLVREPLSGTYNTMEYNVPNTTTNKTSQDVGFNQAAAQQNCMLSGGVEVANPTLKFTASNKAVRLRAIGTGEELAQVGSFVNTATTDNNNNVGYGFWSAANFASLGAVTHTSYYTVDGVDPLNKSSISCPYTGTIPTTSTQLGCIDMHNVANGTYPIYSLLRMVNTDTTISATVKSLALSADDFGTLAAHPDFVVPSVMTTVREHFTPPAGMSGNTYPSTLTDGDKQFTNTTNCSALPEAGGDVGGVVVTLSANSSWCSTNANTHGQTGSRR